MHHEAYQYVDTALGGVHRRNHVLPEDQLKQQLPDLKTDCYVTWHRFPQSYLTHCQDTGSTGGYDGPSYTDFLPFYFDGDDLSTVLKRVQEFLKMLQITYEIEGLHGIRCYFSGKKRFHILLSSHLFGGWQFPYSVFLLLKVTHRAIR